MRSCGYLWNKALDLVFSDTNWVPWFSKSQIELVLAMQNIQHLWISPVPTNPTSVLAAPFSCVLLAWRCLPRDRRKQGQCLTTCQGLCSWLKGVFRQKGGCFGRKSYNMDTSQHHGLKAADVHVRGDQGMSHLSLNWGRQSSVSCSYSSELIWFPNFNTKSIFLMGA